ncbi:uncharacterized protein LOC122196574 [Lactuca sativa]|uniref:uncharacterized protein LOC122196574 n=1 Tax=Lactuca sativa TaxID=4236 RepID=UPI0022B068E4|nr:uncharacterized protein LOC122196574 [Lactuca sativa]
MEPPTMLPLRMLLSMELILRMKDLLNVAVDGGHIIDLGFKNIGLGLKNWDFLKTKIEMFKFLGINLSARDKDFSTKTSKFKSREELLEWTQNTARSLGYVIVTRRSKAYGNGFVHTVILICDRGREYKPKEYTSRASGSKKTNCQFQLEGKYSKEHDKWTLRVICDEHNHPPAQHMEGHPFARRLSVDETRLVANLTRKNVAPRDILSALKVQNENNVSTIKTIYNAQQKIRMHEQAGRTPMQHCNKSITLEDDRRSFRSLWNLLIDSPTLMDYTKNYMRLQSMLIKYPRVLKYIEDTWLNNYKEMFVSVWIDQHLNFGNNTTNRFESAHANLKRFLDSASSNLDRFVQRINEIVQSQLTSINESFEKSLIFRYKHHNLYCFGLLRGSVSNEALDIIVGELQRLNVSKLDSSNCGCKLRTSCGLPCACMLSVYLSSGEEIPLDLIDIFWRKLSISDTKPEKKRQYLLRR